MPMPTLITDRTQADLDRMFVLAAKGYANMTSAEKTEWATNLKGSYNYADLNRVGTAVLFLESLLNAAQSELDAYMASHGVAPDALFNVTWGTFSLTVKTDWTSTDIPTPTQLTVYLQNVDDLTSAITITRSLPSSMTSLTISGANGIEKAILDEQDALADFIAGKKTLIDNTAASFVYCGMPNSGMIWSEFTI